MASTEQGSKTQWVLVALLVVAIYFVWKHYENLHSHLKASVDSLDVDQTAATDQPADQIPAVGSEISAALPTIPVAKGNAQIGKTSAAAEVANPPLPADRSVRSIEGWLDSLPLQPRELALRDAFGNTPQAQELSRMMILANQQDKLSKEDYAALEAELQNSYIEDFHGHPEASMKALQDGLSRLSHDDYPIERSSIIGTVAAMPGGQDMARQYGFAEMLESKLPETSSDDKPLAADPNYQSAVLAEKYFLDNCSTAEQAIEGTREALSRVTDPRLRSLYRAQFIDKFPGAAKEITL